LEQAMAAMEKSFAKLQEKKIFAKRAAAAAEAKYKELAQEEETIRNAMADIEQDADALAQFIHEREVKRATLEQEAMGNRQFLELRQQAKANSENALRDNEREERDLDSSLADSVDRLKVLEDQQRAWQDVYDEGQVSHDGLYKQRMDKLEAGQAADRKAHEAAQKRNRLQDAFHLRVGGFMYGKGVKYEGVDTMRPHTLTENDMQMIRSYLTDEQMAFADAMVKYLSEDIAKIGNEVSMRLYGYEKYKESYYFPYGTDKRFLVSDLTQTGDQVRQPKSQGFTRALLQNAATPLTVDNFMDMWGSHIKQMALYKGFAEAVDTMSRVFNQRAAGEIRVDSMTGEEFAVPPESNWIEMEKALGAEGVDYLKTLVRDVSGGVRADERAELAALLKGAGAIDAALAEAKRLVDAAVARLAELRKRAEGEGRTESLAAFDSLADLARFVVKRDK
jgi:hypothetical protein